MNHILSSFENCCTLLQTRIHMEDERLDGLPIGLRRKKMERDSDLKNEKECFQCYYDLHLSAASCICSPEKFACPRHANQICSCEITKKFILVRYSLDELQQLVKALEGNLDALRVWILKDFIKDHVNDDGSFSELAVENNDPDVQILKGCKEEGVSGCLSEVDNSSGNKDLKKNCSAICSEQPPSYLRNSPPCSVSCRDGCAEVLTLGQPVSGKLWCSKNAIFPKGNKVSPT